MKNPIASVLSVGTELLLGQTTNRHGAWISAQLAEKGMETAFHLTVADDRAVIADALEKAKKESNLIFITGGLGPTTDDFTREIVAKFLDLDLIWNEATWDHIVKRLTERSLHVHDFQKQQAFFPRDAVLLENPRGTAHGFYIDHGDALWFVLPGPPAELQGIWHDHIDDLLQKKFPALDPIIVRTWDTLGYGESEIAFRTEEALSGSSLVPGYRVHLPYVEVKLTYRRSEKEAASTYVERVDRALVEVTALRDQKKSTTLLADLLSGKDFCLIDEVSDGFLVKALLKEEKCIGRNRYLLTSAPTENSQTNFEFCLHARKSGEHAVEAHLWSSHGKRHEVVIKESTVRSPLLKERQKQELIERACLFWIQTLQSQST